MNVSGIELTRISPQVKCWNAYCTEIAPICFIGVDHRCDRNRGKAAWTHHSFGEHICSNCKHFFDYISKSSGALTIHQDAWYRRLKEWTDSFKDWSMPYGKKTKLSVYDFITNNLLPWWIQCNNCGRWRQISIGLATKPEIFSPDFTCSMLLRLRVDPCSQPEDQRITLVLHNRVNFQASMQMPGLVHNSPLIYLCPVYSPVLLGIEPPSLGSDIDLSKFDDWSLNYPEFRKPFCRPNEFPIPPGSWSPIELFKWENCTFPFMTRYPSLYRAIRNTVIHLWNHKGFRFITAKIAARHLFIRGLIRIVIVEVWLPFLIAHLTYRGLINVGPCVLLSQPVSSRPRRTLIMGPIDLKSAILKCQLQNSFELRRGTSKNASDTVEFYAVESIPTPGIFGQSQCSVILGNGVQNEVMFLNHGIGNHVVDPVNNNVMVLAHQLRLTTAIEPSPIIFNTRSERLVVIVQDVFIRVQKHAYEVFLQIMTENAVGNEFSNAMTVQERFDTIHIKMMERFSDQADFQNDSQICEYFLGCIEERLVERFLVSDDEDAPSNVSLCDIPLTKLRSFLSKSDPFYLHSLSLLTENYEPLNFIGINAHDMLVNQLISSSSKENQVCGVVVKHIGPGSGLYILRRDDTGLQPVTSVLVTLPSTALKIIFCDDPLEEALNLDSMMAEDGILSIYLPHHFRISSCQNKPKEKEVSDMPLCISVTLVYPSPWWRTLLSRAMEPDSLLLEGYGVDLDEFPEDSRAPALFSFIPEDRSLRGFCHNFRDISPSEPADGVGIIQTVILSGSIDGLWAKNDTTVAQMVHSYLVRSLKAGKGCIRRYLASSVNRLYSPAASHIAENAPFLEARSVKPSLKNVDLAVCFKNARDSEVVPTETSFSITKDWWELLSDGASIHVLPELTRSYSETTNSEENEGLAKDALSWAVMIGLRWAKFYLSENPSTCWSEKRAVASLMAATVNQRDATCTDNTPLSMEDAAVDDDGSEGDSENVDDDDESENLVPGAFKRSSPSLRRSSRSVKRPCTLNL